MRTAAAPARPRCAARESCHPTHLHGGVPHPQSCMSTVAVAPASAAPTDVAYYQPSIASSTTRVQQRESRSVYLQELSIIEYCVLDHLGLALDDMRMNRDGTLAFVQATHGPHGDSYSATIRTRLGHATVVTFSRSDEDDVHLVGAVDALLFSLAVARVQIPSSSVFISTDDAIQLTILCDKRDIPIIKYEMDYAFRSGCFLSFTPIRFYQKEMTKTCSLGTFQSAFAAATAVALASNVHYEDHAMLANHSNSRAPNTTYDGSCNNKRCGLATRIRTKVHSAQQASHEQSAVFWSSLEST